MRKSTGRGMVREHALEYPELQEYVQLDIS